MFLRQHMVYLYRENKINTISRGDLVSSNNKDMIQE